MCDRSPPRCGLCLATHELMRTTAEASLIHLDEGEIDQAREYLQTLRDCGFGFVAAAEIEELTSE